LRNKVDNKTSHSAARRYFVSFDMTSVVTAWLTCCH